MPMKIPRTMFSSALRLISRFISENSNFSRSFYGRHANREVTRAQEAADRIEPATRKTTPVVSAWNDVESAGLRYGDGQVVYPRSVIHLGQNDLYVATGECVA